MGKCKAKTEVYSRVVGYYRPVQQWNLGKQAEFHARKPYAITKKTLGSLAAHSANRKDKS